LAKIFASRLQNVLPDIINNDQAGYLNNRFIGQNIRLLEDVSTYTEFYNLPGIIFSIDFEKAFDSINWTFLLKSLESFNFGNTFISYIQTMYKNIEATVINNGTSNNFFKIHKGVRQGCPLSAYLFIIAIEILAIHVRNNSNIKGIQIGNQEIKISLLADDITLLLQDLNSIPQILNTLKKFHSCSGLKINIEKSNAKYIGSLITCDHYPHGLSWIKTPIYTLGIHIVTNQELNYTLNFAQKIKNLKTKLDIWKQRQLSLKGKITIINNLALSPLIYVASVVDTPQKAISMINNLIQNFLWNNSTSKISQNTLIQEIKHGGLKLCHFNTKIESLKLSWIKRLTNSCNHNWKIIPKLYYKCENLNTYFNANHKILENNMIPKFYTDIHITYMKYFKQKPTNIKEILDQSLWLNENIKIGNKYIYFKEWEKKGINKISDLFNKFGILYSHNQLSLKYNINSNFLQTAQIQTAIPPSWKKVINEYITPIIKENVDIRINLNETYRPLHSIKCKDFYWHIINSKQHKPTCISKWAKSSNYFSYDIDPKWKYIFTLPFTVTNETRLQSFQYKIINRTIACNKWLHSIKIKQSSKCEYCEEEDSINHFFLLCLNANNFWVSFNQWWNNLTQNNLIELTQNSNIQDCILLGFPKDNSESSVLNYCSIVAKNYIYNSKMNKNNILDFYIYLIILKQKLKIKKYISSKENKSTHFEKFNFIFNNI
jgi:hypothetical protein